MIDNRFKRTGLIFVLIIGMLFGGIAGTVAAQDDDNSDSSGQQSPDEIVCPGGSTAEGAQILAFIISLLVYGAILAAIIGALFELIKGMTGVGESGDGGVSALSSNIKAVVAVVIGIYLIVLFSEPLFQFDISCLFPFI